MLQASLDPHPDFIFLADELIQASADVKSSVPSPAALPAILVCLAQRHFGLPPLLQKLGPQLSESQLANMNGDAAKAFGNNLNADQVTIDHD